jgi:glycosyltransferase involved in cell wall biosynthesis
MTVLVVLANSWWGFGGKSVGVMSRDPCVSIVCPTYNRGRLIELTIRSVMAQTFGDWELIVASDASDDGTDQVVGELAVDEPRLRLVRTRRFGGPSGPRNVAARLARGDTLAFIDHDDVWAPNHLSVLMAARHDGAELAYVRASLVDGHGMPESPSEALNQYWHPQIQLMSALFEPSRMACRTQLLESVGGWRETATGLEDWDLWVRLADAGVRFTPLADTTVTVLRSPATRRHSLPCDHCVELAAFPDARSARAAFRALTDRRLIGRFIASQSDDLRRWYGDNLVSGALAAPAAWGGGPERLLAAIDESLVAARQHYWDTLTIESGPGRHRLVTPVATQTADHADRIARAWPSFTPTVAALVERVVEPFGGTVPESACSSRIDRSPVWKG